VKLYLVNFPNQCGILSSNIFHSSVSRGKNLWNFWNCRELVRSLRRVCVCVRSPSPKQTQSETLIAFWRRGCSWPRRLISRDSTPALLALHNSGLKLFCASSGDDPQACVCVCVCVSLSLSLSLSLFLSSFSFLRESTNKSFNPWNFELEVLSHICLFLLSHDNAILSRHFDAGISKDPQCLHLLNQAFRS
jgi:hypothetical protein